MVVRHIYSSLLLEDIENIDIWPREIEFGQCVTKLSIKQQGPAIYLSLPSKIRQACIDSSVQTLSSDNDLATFLEKIKGLYAKDKHLLVYRAYGAFETFQSSN